MAMGDKREMLDGSIEPDDKEFKSGPSGTYIRIVDNKWFSPEGIEILSDEVYDPIRKRVIELADDNA